MDDTSCNQVALYQGISTAKLLAANNLDAQCKDFPDDGGYLFVPDNARCVAATLKKDDSCQSFAGRFNVKVKDLVSWNEEFGMECEEFDTFAKLGFVVCVSEPGVNPYAPKVTDLPKKLKS
jgi:hypothetical protein